MLFAFDMQGKASYMPSTLQTDFANRSKYWVNALQIGFNYNELLFASPLHLRKLVHDNNNNNNNNNNNLDMFTNPDKDLNICFQNVTFGSPSFEPLPSNSVLKKIVSKYRQVRMLLNIICVCRLYNFCFIIECARL